MHVVTIGNFDGVHEGHRRLVEVAREMANDGEGPPRTIAVTFDPLPESVLHPPENPMRLSTGKDREKRLLAAGVDEVIELPVTRELLGTDPVDFIEEILERFSNANPIGCFVEGADFRFGRARAGTMATLEEHGRTSGFKVVRVPDVRVRLHDGLEVEVRSSTIRRLLELGRVEDAGLMLGRHFQVQGNVVMGDQRGRQLGYPTMNMDLGEQILPADGVYAGVADIGDGISRPAAVSVGTKPTFEITARVMEAHILDWDGALDDYGRDVDLKLVRRLRGQYRYDGIDPLLAQMQRDCDESRKIFNSMNRDSMEIRE